MPDWPEIRAWRRAERERLIAARLAVPRDERRRAQARVDELIRAHVPVAAGDAVGLYAPIRGEFDLRPLAAELAEQGCPVALPVVVEKDRPVEFWAWRPGERLARGFWNIPVPRERRPVRPTLLLVPLVGFDDACYRLGYGGGYYDRTLAALEPRPRAVGVGFAFGRLGTIYPQPHDIPMDAIVTEEGVRSRGEQSRAPAGRPEGGEGAGGPL